MTDFAARRAANKLGGFHTVKTGFKNIFPHEGLAAKIQEAVQLVTPILTEGSLLANLHVLRCIQSGESLSINQTFFNHCYSAVSHATGNQAQEFDPAKDPSLAASYNLYSQSLPALHTKPLKPTYIKDACNAAAQMSHVNFTNHVATNFERRTKRFIRLELQQIAYFTQIPAARVTSWVSLLYRAASEDSDISQLLPIYTSLVPPEDDDVLEFLDYLVVTMQALMGPLPVTEQSLKRKPDSYLSWMHLVLTTFQAAQGTPYAPKLFTMMPQTGHQTSFIKISTTSLHKFLKAAGEDVPPLTKKIAKEEFTDRPDYWWSRYTRCLSFSRRPPIPPFPQRRHTFHTFKYEVTTDGVSVGVLMLHPAPPPSAEGPPPSAEAQALPPPKKRKRKQRQQRQQTGTEWVRDLPGRDIGQPHRIVGLNPGRKSLFTAAIHSQSAADSLQQQHTPDSTPDSKYTTLSWTSSRWREASGIKYRLLKTEVWYNKKPRLKAALEDTPSAKVATVDLFMQHISYRMRHEAAAVRHFGDRRHRQLRWGTFRRRQSAFAAICRDISAGSKDTVVAYGNASFSSSI